MKSVRSINLHPRHFTDGHQVTRYGLYGAFISKNNAFPKALLTVALKPRLHRVFVVQDCVFQHSVILVLTGSLAQTKASLLYMACV